MQNRNGGAGVRRAAIALAALMATVNISPAFADFTVDLAGGEALEVTEIGAGNDGPLVLWFTNQYGDIAGPSSVAQALARRGATVWQVDLLESLFLTRTDRAVRELDGAAVAALIQHAIDVAPGRERVVLGVDRMGVPVLRGMRLWQSQTDDPAALAGTILLFPNLFRGTPIAGQEPEFFGIVDATNLPVMIIQPEMGVYMNRLATLRDRLINAGSPVFTWVVPEAKDFYFVETGEGQTDSLETNDDLLEDPASVKATRALPDQVIASIPLLSAASHSGEVLEINPAHTEPTEKQTGLQPVDPVPAPDFELVDLYDGRQSLRHDFDGVQIVNFWATWCPACVEELPSMERLASRYPDRLRIYGIAFKETPEHLRDFLQHYDISFPVPVDIDGAVAERYGAFAFPTSFMVAPDGKIHYAVNAGIIWDTPEVDAIMQELLEIKPE